MHSFRLEEFVRTLKYATLLHHHSAIDRIVDEFRRTLDYGTFTRRLIAEVGTSRVLVESAYHAHLAMRETHQCRIVRT